MNCICKRGFLAVLLVGGCIGASSCGKNGSSVASAPLAVVQTNQPPQSLELRLGRAVLQEVDTGLPGWSGTLLVSEYPRTSNQRPPICQLTLQNNTTNTLVCWTGLYAITYSRIELLDSVGTPVAKTLEGQQIATRTNASQIRDMVEERRKLWRRGRARTHGFFPPVWPGRSHEIRFSIPQLFHLTKPGQYTLKLKTCLIQKPGGNQYSPDLEIKWLPEMEVKFWIQTASHSSSSG